MPLAPSGFMNVGVSMWHDLEARQLGGRDERVVGEVRRDRVAVVVVAHLLEQRLGRALGDAAVDLALEQQRVEHPAGVVAGDVAEGADLAGLGVDLDDGDVGAERERRAGGLRRRVSMRQQLAGRRRRRRARPTSCDTAGVPATWNAPSSLSSTMSASSASSSWAASFLACSTSSIGGLVDGGAALLQRARAHRAAAGRHEVGVAPDERRSCPSGCRSARGRSSTTR